MAPEQKGKRRSVLILRFSALGDVAMAVPVVYGVCMSNPDVRFVFVTKAPVAGLLINPPENLTVVGVDLKVKYKGLTGVRHLLRDMVNSYGVTDLADLHDVLRTKYARFLGWLRGLRVEYIDKGRKDKELLVKGVRRQLPSSFERYASVFDRLGLNAPDDFTSVYASELPDPEVYSELTPAKRVGETWIGIAPFAAHITKVYPLKRMEEVIAELSSRRKYKVFLFGGGESERKMFAYWAGKYRGVVSLAEKRWGFGVELALMSALDAMVAMDSGNMHLAALAGVPAVSVWGGTHPFAGFTPWHCRSELMLQGSCSRRPCSVFGNKPCASGDVRCFDTVTPAMILERIDSITVNGE